MQRLEHKSGGYMEGWIAGERGDERRCFNPWNAYWLVDWYRGYDDAVAASLRNPDVRMDAAAMQLNDGPVIPIKDFRFVVTKRPVKK